MIAKVRLLQDRFDPDSLDYDANLSGLATMADLMVVPLKESFDSGGEAYALRGFKSSRFSLARAIGVASLINPARGESFYDYPIWIKVASMDDLVPAGFPNDSYFDENGDAQQHTWRSWSGSNDPFLVDGYYYVGSDYGYSDGHIPLEKLLNFTSIIVDSIPAPI